MVFDDRLSTVLRHRPQSEAAARTQYRQLLDLIGSARAEPSGEALDVAYARLGELAKELPAAVQSAILRAPGHRLRNRALVAWLAECEPQAAAAAMATAELSESDWVYLIPRLPMAARGFLRHRRGLPFSARQVLERLGVGDLVLPEPAAASAARAATPETPPSAAEAPVAPAAPDAQPGSAPGPAEQDEAGIGALVKRIEAFQRARQTAAKAPMPAWGGRAFDFATDARGVVTWADPAMAPLAVGMILGPPRPGAIAMLDETAVRALVRRVPVRGGAVVIDGPPEIAGEWRIDAAPLFEPDGGHFAGYQGRFRRRAPGAPVSAPPGAPERTESDGDRLRQVLHELRTPVNAIQGFAELIQQQMFGPTPNEYRALAAAVAVDAARLMAGFDEIERLARLETGTLELGEGKSDWREVIARILRRLDGALRPRSARIEFSVEGSPFAVGIEQAEALQLAWRLLATLAGAMAPGEIIDLTLRGDGARVTMEIDLPNAMAAAEDVFAASASAQPRAISAGMFGAGFALRLARAEAEAAGGSLERHGERLRLTLPILTEKAAAHTLRGGEHGGASAARKGG